jgi:diketogulonate reductase-like aldo/keto reductase
MPLKVAVKKRPTNGLALLFTITLILGLPMKENDYAISTHGVRIPKLIYGTAWKKERTAELVEQAITLGFRGIDTACQPKHYQEPGVGEGLAAGLAASSGLSRADIYLQTKFTPLDGQDPKRIPYDPKASLAEQVEQSFAVSLNNLRTDYLDCLVLHSPVADGRQMMEVWRAMEALYETGGVKQLGISNCYDAGYLAALYETARVKPAVVQNRFYAATGHDREILAFCRAQGIVYQSFWTLTANPGILAHEIVEALAAKYVASPAQIFFRFLTQSGIIPLTGTSSASHMREDLAIFDFKLADNEREAVAGLLWV